MHSSQGVNTVTSHLHSSLLLTLSRLLPKNIQDVLFSATFPDYVTRYAQKFAPNANLLTLKTEELTVQGIKQLYMDCDSEQHKYEVLVKLYGLMTIGSSIIFVKVSLGESAGYGTMLTSTAT